MNDRMIKQGRLLEKERVIESLGTVKLWEVSRKRERK